MTMKHTHKIIATLFVATLAPFSHAADQGALKRGRDSAAFFRCPTVKL